MPSPESVIHDIGYQRYQGARLGPASAFAALFIHGLRASFGLGRSAKAKIFPWIAIGLVGAAALIIAVARSQGAEDIGYQDLPSIVAVLAVPQLFIYAASAFGSDDLVAETGRLLSGWLISAFYAVIYASIGVLIASVASRRAFAAGAIAAVFLVSLPVMGVLMALGDDTVKSLAPLISPVMLPEAIREWIYGLGNVPIGNYGPLYGAVGVLLPALCALLLFVRYRRVSL